MINSPLLKLIVLVTGFLLLFDRAFAQNLNENQWNRVGLNVQHLSYMRNYEYFNDLQKGYTLFGNTLTPVIRISAARGTHIEAGAFMQYDFGTPAFRKVLPAFAFVAGLTHQTKTIDMKEPQFKREWNIRLGSLDNSKYHLMPEALYNRDQIVFNPIEYGEQFRFRNRYIHSDQWIQWQRMIYYDSQGLEALQAGCSFNVRSQADTNRIHIQIPLYVMAHHKGGQIGTKDSTETGGTTSNLSGGLQLHIPVFSINTLFSIGAQYYWSHQDHSPDVSIPETGNGTELTLKATNRNFSVTIQYWTSQDFYAPYGRFITQSRSSVFTDSPAYISQRQLLFIKACYDYTLNNALSLHIEAEPYYDMNNRLPEYAYHILLRYNFSTTIYSAKRN